MDGLVQFKNCMRIASSIWTQMTCYFLVSLYFHLLLFRSLLNTHTQTHNQFFCSFKIVLHFGFLCAIWVKIATWTMQIFHYQTLCIKRGTEAQVQGRIFIGLSFTNVSYLPYLPIYLLNFCGFLFNILCFYMLRLGKIFK